MGKRGTNGRAAIRGWLPPLTAAPSSLSPRQDPNRRNTTTALGMGSDIFFLVPASGANLLCPSASLPPSSPDHARPLPAASRGASLPPLLCSVAVGKGKAMAWGRGRGEFSEALEEDSNEMFSVPFQSEKEPGKERKTRRGLKTPGFAHTECSVWRAEHGVGVGYWGPTM